MSDRATEIRKTSLSPVYTIGGGIVLAAAFLFIPKPLLTYHHLKKVRQESALEANITLAVQKEFEELGVGAHWTPQLIESHFSPSTFKYMLEHEPLAPVDLWRLAIGRTNEFRGSYFAFSFFDARKYRPWHEAGLDLSSMRTCWDYDYSLELSKAGLDAGLTNDTIKEFLNGGGHLDEFIDTRAKGVSLEEALKQSMYPGEALTDEEKEQYDTCLNTCQEMRVVKAGGIGLDIIKELLEPLSIYPRTAYVEQLPALVRERKINGAVFAAGAAAGHTPVEVLMYVAEGHSHEEFTQWKNAGYSVVNMRDYHKMKDSGELDRIQELVQD